MEDAALKFCFDLSLEVRLPSLVAHSSFNRISHILDSSRIRFFMRRRGAFKTDECAPWSNSCPKKLGSLFSGVPVGIYGITPAAVHLFGGGAAESP